MSRVLSSSFDLLRILAVTSALFGAVACVPQAPAGASTGSEASGNLGAVGAACSHSRNCNDGLACVNGTCTTPDSCGGITAAGRCDPSGRILSWCSDDTLNSIDCAGDPGSEGSVCVDGPVEARCVPAAAPPAAGPSPRQACAPEPSCSGAAPTVSCSTRIAPTTRASPAR